MHTTQDIEVFFMWSDRTKILLGEDSLKKLNDSKVAIIGVGGVGGYVCQMLVRAGIGNLLIVDFDKVDETNINRQVVANVNTVGLFKVDVMKKQLLEINPALNIKSVNAKISKENLEQILPPNEKFDYVVDAIDSVKDKVDLICYCKQNGLKIISAMGAGNRFEVPKFEVMDIYKTSNDGLAKVVRKKLREQNIDSLKVVTSTQTAITQSNKVVGSISYQPAMCGCVLAGVVANDLLDILIVN